MARLLQLTSLALLLSGSSALAYKTPRAVSTRNPDVNSTHYAPLSFSPGKRHHKSARYGAAAVYNDVYSGNFQMNVTVDGQIFELMIDTGSSDTWVAREGFQCSNGTANVTQSECGIGAVFKGSFLDGPIADENFNISYTSGQFVVGQVGYQRVELAGITVERQETALIDYAYWPGPDYQQSGILGLSYPNNTHAWHGSDPAEDHLGEPGHDRAKYSPIFTTMYNQSLIQPVFSIALDRPSTISETAPGGFIAFGGLPPVAIHSEFTSTPILKPLNETLFYSYTVNADALTCQTCTNTTTNSTKLGGNILIDSGTVCISAPESIAAAYNQFFDPPAISPDDLGFYITDCNATAPQEPFQVVIEGRSFEIPGQDLLLGELTLGKNGFPGPYSNYCISGVQSGGLFGFSEYILGRPFLENVVAVFDVGAAEMRFAPRVRY